MTRSINRVTLLGNLGRDSETKFTPSGTALTKFSVACERSWKQGDEWNKETEWVNVVLWADKQFTKGQTVFVEGRLQTRSWDDNGTKRYATEVVADVVQVIAREAKRQTSQEEW